MSALSFPIEFLLGGGGGASSSSSGGGSDWTLATEENAPGGGVRVDTYTTDDGIVWTRNYNDAGDGSLQTDTAVGLSLTRTWSYTAGGIGYVSAGAARKSGSAWRVNSADMATLKTELAALGAAVVAPRFYVQDFNNGVANSGLEVEWDEGSAAFRGVGGAQIKANEAFYAAGAVTYNTFPAESGDLATLTFPGWLASPRTEFELQAFGTDTTSGNVTMNAYMGGSIMGSSSSSSVNQTNGEYRARWWNNNSLTSQLRVGSPGTTLAGGVTAAYGSTTSTTSYTDPAINTGATSVSVTLRIIFGTAAADFNLRRLCLLMRN